MLTTLAQAVGLGIAGIDPFGAAILLSAITAGASRAGVVAFTTAAVGTTVAAGVAVTVAGRDLFEWATDLVPSADSAVWAVAELVAAVVIVAWLVRRRRRGDRPATERTSPTRGGPLAYAAAGAAFSVTGIVDPTFLATAAIAGSTSLATLVAAFTLWTVISQFMLVGLFVAYLAGAHRPLLERVRRMRERHGPTGARLVTGAAIVMAGFLFVDVGWFVATGRYLFE